MIKHCILSYIKVEQTMDGEYYVQQRVFTNQ
jgi:hypothetical protein